MNNTSKFTVFILAFSFLLLLMVISIFTTLKSLKSITLENESINYEIKEIMKLKINDKIAQKVYDVNSLCSLFLKYLEDFQIKPVYYKINKKKNDESVDIDFYASAEDFSVFLTSDDANNYNGFVNFLLFTVDNGEVKGKIRIIGKQKNIKISQYESVNPLSIAGLLKSRTKLNKTVEINSGKHDEMKFLKDKNNKAFSDNESGEIVGRICETDEDYIYGKLSSGKIIKIPFSAYVSESNDVLTFSFNKCNYLLKRGNIK